MRASGQSETPRNARTTFVRSRAVMGWLAVYLTLRAFPAHSLVGVFRHDVERRSNTLLARDHLAQLDRKAVDETRPRRRVRLGPHAVVDGIECDAKVASRAGSDPGLGFDPRVVEVALTDRARATAEEAGSGGDVGARGPLHENPGRIRPFAVHRESQIRAALTTEARRLIEAALAGGSQGSFRRTGGGLNEADHLRLRRVVAE